MIHRSSYPVSSGANEMITEKIEMHGTLTLRLTDQQGQVVHQTYHRNRIVTTGRELVAKLFAGQVTGVPPTAVTHMAVGTDGTDPTDADTALRAEISPRKLVSVEYSKMTENNVERIRARLTAIFEFGEANGPLREAGIFTAAAGGVLYNRVKFDTVTKTIDFKLTMIWDIVF
jgi:hypothetical protein